MPRPAVPICSLFLAFAAVVPVAPVRAQARAVDSVGPTTAQEIAPATRGFFRQPAIHGDIIVFVAEGDLWRVPVSGGAAIRLTTHAAEETRPAISPDGRWVAFSASYEGPREVYVMSVNGGRPERQTWEGGGADVTGWTPDGRVLYTTQKYSTLPNPQLISLSPCLPGTSSRVCTPARIILPFATAADGAFTEDGAAVFFTRYAKQSSFTKRYIGGTAENIWRWDASGDGTTSSGPAVDEAVTEARPLTADYPGTSRSPQLWNGRLYFASDRAPRGTAYPLGDRSAVWDAGVMNIWSMNLDGADVRQHTFHTDYDVMAFSLDGGRLAYRQGADIRVLDLERSGVAGTGPGSSSEGGRVVDIRLNSDFDQMRENWVESPMQYLTSAHLSPSGDRVALVSRGEVFVAPVDAGRFVHVTRQAGVRYREARFRDDDRLLTLSDESGEVELWTMAANGLGGRDQLTDDGTILRWDALPSPDGRWIAHHDKNQDLYLYDTRDGTNRRISHDDGASAWISSATGYSDLAWSPDSRWLAFNETASNFLGRIIIHDTQDGTSTPVTSDRYDSWSPAWSRDGKWLWFLSDRTFSTSVGSPWGARQPDPYFDRQTLVFGLSLKQGERSPFLADDELSADSTAPVSTPDSARSRSGRGAVAGARPAPSPAPVTIDFDGIQQRIIEVPVPAGDHRSLSTAGTRLYWLTLASRSPSRTNLVSLDVAAPSARPTPVIEDISGYELSADGTKLMIVKGQELYVFDAGPRAPQNLADSRVDLNGWTFSVDPAEEWAHHFVDAWRLERDYFYDPGMHGIDWPAMLEKYRPLADRVTDRNELNDVIAQMVGELSTLHIFVRGGDTRDGSDDIAVASLGGVLERDDAGGGWRVAHVYRSDPDIPDEVSPLARPGIDIREGDVITAIDGVSTLTVPDPALLLRNRAGRQVRLSVRSHDTSTGSPAMRDAIVVPISQARERDLRYDEWEYSRRLAVEEGSSGRLGYVHIRAMGGGNVGEWMREYYPVFNREGLILDVRHNTGGNIDSWLLGKLLRETWFWWQPRVGRAYGNMPYSFRGPIVVLVDERTASDGEAFAEGFRRLGLGPVIGIRTWGGEVWLSSNNFQADRGIATAAEQGVYGPEGEWLIEGWGVDPDQVIDNTPVATFNGEDAQLDAAIRYLLNRIESNPVVAPPAPKYPDKSRRGTPGG